jgi:hypothetical protein
MLLTDALVFLESKRRLKVTARRQLKEKNWWGNEAGAGTEEGAEVETEKGVEAETEGGAAVGIDAEAAGTGDAGEVVAKKDEWGIAKRVAVLAKTAAEIVAGVNPGKKSFLMFHVLARYSWFCWIFYWSSNSHLQIYNGKVSNVVAFGCFVQLDGLAKRWEGLVHISQLRKEGRVTEASEVVQRGQKVKASKLNAILTACFFINFVELQVKVLTFTGQKVSLSMKEVDQETGVDLNPSIVWKPGKEG